MDLRPYRDARTAAADVTEHAARSPYVASLNGDWRLRVFDRPTTVPAGFGRDGFDASAWPTAQVPHTWQSDSSITRCSATFPRRCGRTPAAVPRDVNPTGAYLKTFEVPANWSGGRVFLRFEAVTSGYFVWVNGGYVGYDQGGYTPAEFDVTDRLRPGRNRCRAGAPLGRGVVSGGLRPVAPQRHFPRRVVVPHGTDPGCATRTSRRTRREVPGRDADRAGRRGRGAGVDGAVTRCAARCATNTAGR